MNPNLAIVNGGLTLWCFSMGKARKMGWFMEYRCLLGGDWNMNVISHDFPFNWEWNNHPNWLELHHFSEGQVYHQPGLVDMGGCWWISDIRDIDVLGLIRLRQSLTYIYIFFHPQRDCSKSWILVERCCKH